MPKNISNTDSGGSGGVFPQILVNTFAAKLNSNSNSFLVYNSTPTDPLFKIDGSGVTPTATFYCDLNVVGSASFTSVSNIEVTSSMMSLATGNSSSDLIDIGFYGLYNSGGNKYRGLVRSTSLGRWALFKDINTVPSTTIALSGSWRDTLELQDLYFNGDGSTLSALKTDVDLFPDALQSLTTAEINQLQNINSNTISSTQWSYISNSNQRTDTAGTPSFSGLTLSTGVASLPAGTFITPTLNFSDSGSGIYRPAANQIGVSTNGTLNTYWTTGGMFLNTGVLTLTSGIASTPTLNFGSSTTGFYQAASNSIGLSISGSNLMTWNSTGETLASGALRVPNGTVGTPSFNLGSTTTGFYQPASNQIGVSVSGSNIGTWSSTGLVMNTLAISGISTASGSTANFTTLTGTLSTASQPNVTTLAGVTSIGTNYNAMRIMGQIAMIGVVFDPFTAISISASSSFYDLIQINGTLGTSFDVYTMYLMNFIPIVRTAGNEIYGIKLTPFYTYYANSGTTYSIYINPSYTFNNGSFLDTSYGIYVANQATGTNTSITGYFEHPSAGATNRIGVYAGSLSVGSTTQLLLSGYSYFANTITMGTGQILVPAGSEFAPSISFNTVNSTGLYQPNISEIAITCNGTLNTKWNSAGQTLSTGVLTVPNGLFGTPSITFAGNSTVGLNYDDGTIVIGNGTTYYAILGPDGISTNGSFITAPRISTTGNGVTNATYLALITALMTVNANSTTCNTVHTYMRFNLAAGTTGYKQRQYYAVFDNVSIGSGATMTEMIGFYSDTFINVTNSGTLTTACSAYFKTQTVAATNNCAVFAEDLVIGSSIGTPPTNGAMISGNTLIGTTSNPDSRKLLVNGSIESSTGGIYGTLQTVSQPNITTIGSTGIVLYNPGSMTIGSSSPSNAILTVDNGTTFFLGDNNYASLWTKGTINLFTAPSSGSVLTGLRLNETLTSSAGFNNDEYHALYIATTISPAGGSSNIYRGITVAPTIGTAGSSNGFIGINVVPSFSNGTNLTTLTGITVTDFTAAASTITSVIGGSFPHPGVSSTGARMGLYAGSLSVGDNTKAMTSSNLYVAGTTTHNSTAIFAAGAVGTPSLYMSTDSTTGFYRPGANQIGIAISGSLVGTWSSIGLAMNSLAISGVSTLTATTLGGTLSTASQPNVTTLAGVTSIGNSGNIALLNTVSIGTASPASGAELYVTSSSNTESWVNAPAASLSNRIWSKDGVAVWQNYIPANSTEIRWFANSADRMTLTSGGALTVSSITGTIITASQTNITSVGTLTGLTVNTSGTIGLTASGNFTKSITGDNTTTVSGSSSWSTVGSSTNGYAFRFNGATTAIDASNNFIYGYFNPSFTPTNGTTGIISGIQVAPTVVAPSTKTIAIFANIVSNPQYNSNVATITTAIGIYGKTGSSGAGTITSAYSGYFEAPTAGTNKYALYAENITTNATVVPPTGGIYSAGHIRLAASANLAVNGTTPATTLGLTANLPIVVGSGNASGPGYAFFGDNTAGMYYTTNALNFATSSTQRAFIDSSGLTLKNTGFFICDAGTSSGGQLHVAMRSTGSTLRWGIGLQDTESTGNAGSNFKIYSYADNGAFINVALDITRATNRFQTVGSTVIGPSTALATNATSGFLYIPSSAGAPTGVPGAETGKVAMQYDTTNNKLYVYNGAWKSVTLA